MTQVDGISGHTLKSGDDLIDLRVKLVDDGDPFNLDDSTDTVTMKMRRSDGDTLVVDDTMTIDDGARGLVSREWSSGETDTTGTFEAEFVVDDGTGSKVTFPSLGYFIIRVQEGL